MPRKIFTRLLLAASVAALIPVGAAQAQTLQSAELSAFVGTKGFEFRGRHQMWKFGADGRVTADDSEIARLALGGSGETFGMKKSGTWRLAGNQLCIQWQAAQRDECYTITRRNDGMVTLAGAKAIVGQIYPNDGDSGFAERPEAPAPATPPGYRYQRIPGAR